MLYKNTQAAPAGPRSRSMILVLVVTAILALAGTVAPAKAQIPQHWSVTIDASTTQPVGTGFWAPSGAGDVIIFAEGAVRGPTHPERFEQGWFGPAGQDRYEDAGQPVVDGMPYGALVGGFSSNVPGFQFMGRMGTFSLQPAHTGQQLHLALNLSNADLATLDGQITVNVIYLPPGVGAVSKFVIDHTTPLPLATGLMAAEGDQYVVLPRGGMRDPALANSAYTDGWFGPEGLLGLASPTQPFLDGGYGALYGTYGPAANGFYLGDGGCWTAQIADQGMELELLINADAASLAGIEGGFVVYLVRIPALDPAGVTPDGGGSVSNASAFPNPMRDRTLVRFRLDREDHVCLRVFDAHGRSVRLLADDTMPAGPHEIAWDGKDESQRRLPAGAYFYQYSTREGTEAGRLVIVD